MPRRAMPARPGLLVAVTLGVVFYWFDMPALVWASAALLVVGLIVGWALAKAGYGVNGSKYTPKEH